MALDPRIAMGVQPIQIEPQANALMRALQITNAMQQNRLAAMQGQDMAEQRRMQREQMQNALMQQQQRRQFLGQFNPLAGPARPMDPQALFASGLFSAEEADKVGKLGEEKLHNLGPGGRLVTGSGQVRAEAPFKPAEPPQPPNSVREYEFAKSQGYKGTFEQWDRESKKAGATTVNNNMPQPVPAGVVKQQDEMIDRLTNARAIDADLGAIQQQINAGQLKFGPVRNLVNQGKNMAGMSDEESRRFASFKSSLEKLRNDSLRLNAGVQTEGDAQRAWNELFQSINDTEFVNSRLAEIRKINQRAAQLQQYRMQVLRENFGAQPLAAPNIEPALPAPKAQRSTEDLLKQYGPR